MESRANTLLAYLRRNKWSVLFLLVMSILAVKQCLDSEWYSYRRARTLDKVPIWKSFLETAQDPDRIAFAQSRLTHVAEEAAWTQATSTNDGSATMEYVKAFRNGSHAEEAILRLLTMAQENWREATRLGYFDALQQSRLEGNQAYWSDSAKAILSALADSAYNEISQSTYDKQLESFIGLWKDMPAASKAQRRLDQLWNSIEWVRNENTKEAYERFIERNPNSSDVQYCQKRLIDLEVADAVTKQLSSPLGQLPRMERIGASEASGQSEITVINETGYVLTLLYSGPSSTRVVLQPKEERYVALVTGSYKVLASVNAASVSQYYGTESLSSDKYEVTFYIEREGVFDGR